MGLPSLFFASIKHRSHNFTAAAQTNNICSVQSSFRYRIPHISSYSLKANFQPSTLLPSATHSDYNNTKLQQIEMSDTCSVALQSFLPASGSLLGHNQPIKPSDLDFIFRKEYPAKVGGFEPSDLAVGLPHLGSPTSVVSSLRKRRLSSRLVEPLQKQNETSFPELPTFFDPDEEIASRGVRMIKKLDHRGVKVNCALSKNTLEVQNKRVVKRSRGARQKRSKEVSFVTL